MPKREDNFYGPHAHFWCLHWGNLNAALKLAHEEAPENPQVRMSIAAGYPGCGVVSNKTPEIDQIFIKDYFNSKDADALAITLLA